MKATLMLELPEFKHQEVVAVDTETTALDEMVAELVGISLCVEAGEACYIPLIHKLGDDDLFGGSKLAEGQMTQDEALKILKPVFRRQLSVFCKWMRKNHRWPLWLVFYLKRRFPDRLIICDSDENI